MLEENSSRAKKSTAAETPPVSSLLDVVPVRHVPEPIGRRPWRRGSGVVMDAVVGGDDEARVVPFPLHPLLHAAPLAGAPVVVPGYIINNYIAWPEQIGREN